MRIRWLELQVSRCCFGMKGENYQARARPVDASRGVAWRSATMLGSMRRGNARQGTKRFKTPGLTRLGRARRCLATPVKAKQGNKRIKTHDLARPDYVWRCESGRSLTSQDGAGLPWAKQGKEQKIFNQGGPGPGWTR